MVDEARVEGDGEGFAPNQRLPGTKYVIVRVVGEGAMGVVYECIKHPGIRCVVKVMRSYLTKDADQLRRFRSEVRALAELDHPNIVRVFDYDVLADGTPFFAMELLHGRSLREVLAERNTLPPRVAAKIIRQLLSALDCAHLHTPPLVHRDVKPDNVFLHSPKNDESTVKLLDFGVATVSLRNTSMAGTWGYMAPEQLLGQPVTARTDVYAAAVLLFEMLAGKLPFHTNDLDAMAQATLHAVPPRLSELLPWVPRAVDDAVASALEKDPARRPPSAAAFARELAELDRDDLDASNASLALGGVVPLNARTEASLTAIVKAVEVGAPEPSAAHDRAPREPSAPFSSSVLPRTVWFRKSTTAAIVAGSVIGLGGAALIVAFVPRPAPATRTSAAPSPSPSPSLAPEPPSALPLAAIADGGSEQVPSGEEPHVVSSASAPAASVVAPPSTSVRRPAAPPASASSSNARFEPSIGD
ncbi:MAG: serine/threonine protein kinase [Labilithrix sp.]|nr:serine/threonine protein kinase [Labilithrix sp.]MCW5809388.1 serine/threonine protein kinase [Labilithrix sp.]